jgi:hypothetical protein
MIRLEMVECLITTRYSQTPSVVRKPGPQSAKKKKKKQLTTDETSISPALGREITGPSLVNSPTTSTSTKLKVMPKTNTLTKNGFQWFPGATPLDILRKAALACQPADNVEDNSMRQDMKGQKRKREMTINEELEGMSFNIYYWPDAWEKDKTLENVQVEKPAKVEHPFVQELEISCYEFMADLCKALQKQKDLESSDSNTRV